MQKTLKDPIIIGLWLHLAFTLGSLLLLKLI